MKVQKSTSRCRQMIKLLIADDHTIFREGLVYLLRNSDDIEVVAEVGNGADAWEKIQQLQPNVAVLDINMPESNGLQVADLVLENNLPTHIIFLTMHDEPTITIKAKKKQVKGYVLKDDAFDELLEAIKAVANGQSYMSAALEDKLENYNTKRELSNRESTVLKLVAQGLTTVEISEQLKISPKTVDTYRTRIMNKLELHSIAELTQYAIKIGVEF